MTKMKIVIPDEMPMAAARAVFGTGVDIIYNREMLLDRPPTPDAPWLLPMWNLPPQGGPKAGKP